MFFIGFLSGIVFCILAAIIQFRYEPNIERAIDQVQRITRQHGEILEDQHEKAEIISGMLKNDDV